eukprot:gene4733-8650_t
MFSDGKNDPIVIDNGSFQCKAGFAGDDSPRVIFPSVIGHPCHCEQTTSSVANQNVEYVGHAARSRIDERLDLRFPIQRGIITDWDGMEKLWYNAFYDELHVATENHPIFLTDSLLNPKDCREKIVEIMFESFHAPAICIAPQSVLSLYASGRTTGIGVESGDGVTQIVPIIEGYIPPYATQCLNLAGHDLTNHLITLLAERDYSFTTRQEKEIARNIKEKLSYVSIDFDREIQATASSSSIEKSYTLPDGSMITIGEERFRCSEIIFQPQLAGIEDFGLHTHINSIISKCNMEIRQMLSENIILSGGTSMIYGFSERLQQELAQASSLAKVNALPDRKLAAWTGGSILASMLMTASMWTHKREYEDFGPSIIHYKCTSPYPQIKL